MTAHQILIVDDSLTVRMDLAGAFSAAGFEVLLCASAAEARQCLGRGPVDAIVLDVLLPDANGVDLLIEIRGMPQSAAAAVVMLSSEDEVKHRIRGLKTGADEYVGKPYDVQYLVAKVEELVRARRPRDRTTLLIIDDSATFRDRLGETLRRAGYDVLESATGEDGLRMAGSQRPDGIVVDGVLPGMDGPTLIRHVRLDTALRDVPCLLLTGSEGPHAELRALDAGADAFVRKEEDLDVIVARLAAMLRRSPARLAAVDRTKSLSGRKRILAVDDSPTFLQSLAQALKDEGYDVIAAHSGEEALELLAVQFVDCILLDLLMPGLSGQQTCERIKAAPAVRDTPLIMLTALENRDAMIQGLGAGADDYISKSSEWDVLKARVRAQIRRKQFEDENRSIRNELLAKELEATEARAARELAAAKALLVDELEYKNKELEAFSYSVSHDLRAPLRAIAGFSTIVLETSSDALDAKGRDYLARIVAASRRMGELIDDLLNLSRVGRAELCRTPVNLADVADGVVAELRKSADRRVQFISTGPMRVEADPRLMRIVLENLLGNSWKFTAAVTEGRIELGQSGEGSGAVYFIRDNGAGFDPAQASRLFRPFQRLHSDREFAGTGIGLATVQRIIERHGGRVWADGRVGEGATFSFTLPPAKLASLADASPNQGPRQL